MQSIVPRMNPSQAKAWLALVATAELLPSALDARLTADAGLINFEYGILGILNLAPENTLRSGELATALNSTAPRLSKAITRLEKRGLVERVTCVGDGRAINVHLTRSGRRAWLKATPPHIEFARDTLLAGFSDEQLLTLAELLETLTTRLDPDHALGTIPARAQRTAATPHSSPR